MAALSDAELAARVAEEAAEGERVRLGQELPTALIAAISARSAPTDNGHADLVVLPADEVSESGNVVTRDPLATAMKNGLGSEVRLVLVMPHVTEDGKPRIVAQCSRPPTLTAAAHRIITELSVIDVTPEGLLLRELAPKVSARDVQAVTGARLLAGPDLRPIVL